MRDIKDVKTLRENAGLTQAKLSEMTGIPQSRIAKWEVRGTSPRVEDYEKVLKAIGLSTKVHETGAASARIPASQHIKTLERMVEILEDQVKKKDQTIIFQQNLLLKCEEKIKPLKKAN